MDLEEVIDNLTVRAYLNGRRLQGSAEQMAQEARSDIRAAVIEMICLEEPRAYCLDECTFEHRPGCPVEKITEFQDALIARAGRL